VRERFFGWGAQTEQLRSWGSKKLVRNKQDNQIQSVTLCNMYFSKKVYAMYNGVWGKVLEAGEFSRIFVLKVTLQSVSYKKNWESRMY